MPPNEWEERYRSGDTPWEKGQPHPALIQWLESHRLLGRVLVPGCGNGHDVRALAAAGAEVVGLDIARSAIEGAERFPYAGSEKYVCGDLFAPPEEWSGAFDGVFEHTCFCAISPDRREDYARAVTKILKPGGKLLAIFYLDPGNDHDGPPYGCKVEELDSFFQPAFRLVDEWRNITTYPSREGRELMRLYRK